MISAPKTSRSWRRSIETFVGSTTFRWYPFSRQTIASAMPVFPDEGSISTWSGLPGTRMPSASAASTRLRATRSLTEPAGLRPSSFSQIDTSGFGLRAETSTMGVDPMSSSTEE